MTEVTVTCKRCSYTEHFSVPDIEPGQTLESYKATPPFAVCRLPVPHGAGCGSGEWIVSLPMNTPALIQAHQQSARPEEAAKVKEGTRITTDQKDFAPAGNNPHGLAFPEDHRTPR